MLGGTSLVTIVKSLGKRLFLEIGQGLFPKLHNQDSDKFNNLVDYLEYHFLPEKGVLPMPYMESSGEEAFGILRINNALFGAIANGGFSENPAERVQQRARFPYSTDVSNGRAGRANGRSPSFEPG